MSLVEYTIKITDSFIVPEILDELSVYQWENILRILSEFVSNGKIITDEKIHKNNYENEMKFKNKLVDKDNEIEILKNSYENRINEINKSNEDRFIEKNKVYDERFNEMNIRNKEMLSEKDKLIDSIKISYEERLLEKDKLNESIKTSYETRLNENEILNCKLDIITDKISLNKNVPSYKGLDGETRICEYLYEKFPSSEIKNVSETPHSGDIVFNYENISLMFEIKNKKYINIEDVNKFEDDLKNNPEYDGGILLSFNNTGIPKKGKFHMSFVDNRPVLYVTNISEEPNLISLAIISIIALIKKQNAHNNNGNEIDFVSERKKFIRDINNLYSMNLSNIENLKFIIKDGEKSINDTQRMISRCNTQIYEIKKNIEDVITDYSNEIDVQECQSQSKKYNNSNDEYNKNLDYFNKYERYFETVSKFKNENSGIYLHKELLEKCVENNENITYHGIKGIVTKTKFNIYYKRHYG